MSASMHQQPLSSSPVAMALMGTALVRALCTAAGLAPSLTGCDKECCLTAVIEENARGAAPK